MKSFDFTLRLHTPAFTGAAQQGTKRVDFKKKNRQGDWEDTHKDVPYYPTDPGGIRIPSLRGLLAFWYRSTLGHLTPEDVFRGQSGVFGSIDQGQGLRIRPCGANFKTGVLRYVGRRENPFEHLYLGYGPLQLLKVADAQSRNGVQDVVTSCNSSACRNAILVSGVQAEIRFAAHGTIEQLKALQHALSLLHCFGGIGARSRRGWGSVEVQGEGIAPIPPATKLPSHLAEAVKNSLGSPIASIPRPRFSALSSESRLFLTSPMSTADDVLIEFAQCLLAERSYRAKAPRAIADHGLEKSDYDLTPATSITGIPSRLAFGMPFHPQHGKNWDIEYRGRLPKANVDDLDPDDDVKRRASPLLLKVLRTADGHYVGAALFLKADFFGDPNREIGAKGKLLTKPLGPAEYQVVEDFLKGTSWTSVPL